MDYRCSALGHRVRSLRWGLQRQGGLRPMQRSWMYVNACGSSFGVTSYSPSFVPVCFEMLCCCLYVSICSPVNNSAINTRFTLNCIVMAPLPLLKVFVVVGLASAIPAAPLKASNPNAILALGVQTLSSPSAKPETTGVRVILFYCLEECQVGRIGLEQSRSPP